MFRRLIGFYYELYKIKKDVEVGVASSVIKPALCFVDFDQLVQK
jgi:hypothetical protein